MIMKSGALDQKFMFLKTLKEEFFYYVFFFRWYHLTQNSLFTSNIHYLWKGIDFESVILYFYEKFFSYLQKIRIFTKWIGLRDFEWDRRSPVLCLTVPVPGAPRWSAPSCTSHSAWTLQWCPWFCHTSRCSYRSNPQQYHQGSSELCCVWPDNSHYQS